MVQKIDSYNSFLLENEFNEDEFGTDKLNSERNRFELVKKDENKKEDLNLAYYIDTEVATDIVIDEKNINLSLIPIYETMLFSGIPEPKFRPIPEKPDYTKSVILSLKNKKMLQKNLENYVPNKFLEIFEGTKDYIDFGIEENITFQFDNNENVVEIRVFSKDFRHLNFRRNLNNNFVSFYEDAPTTSKVVRNRLKVKNSVSRTLKSAEIPPNIAKEFLHQLSYTIDFQRDVKNGDIIDILYEANFTKNENIVGKPSLLYGLMHLTDHKLELFKYKLNSGKTDYFDASGKSIRKHLMRTPVQGARLSSKFGVRKHPILGYSKMHRGVDFAAKRGTPIMAAGDGRVTFAGRNGSFGRFIEIKHLNNFKTRYAHLYKFSKGIKKGKVVKQGDIIGFVGTSGRSTGPHLHYEVKHKNRTINPIKLRLESTINVDDKDMSNFYANVALTRERFLATEFEETETAGNY
ncbi:MAG: M23 family metallopeptidase [Pseudomonadota bacterium]|nr:M23 family metallopeptidase [Pseudomonadota bacterium]